MGSAMTDTPPFFSVITATHLRADLLRRALASLRAQTFGNFELIVVSDANDAATAAVCAELLTERDVFIKRNGPGGPARSRNVGMDLARGDWVCFLDDDDSFKPTHLELAHLTITQPASDAIRAARVLYSDYEVVTEDRAKDFSTPLQRIAMPLAPNPVHNLEVKNFIPNNVLFFQRQVLEGTRVDPALDSQEDWDFLLGVYQKSRPVYYPGGGAIVHKDYVNPGTRRGTQTTSNDNTTIVDFLHVYRHWRATTPELQAQRHTLFKSIGLDLPQNWF